MDSDQLLKSINQNINEAIYRSNAEGIIYVNKAFADMFGFKDEEEVYRSQPISLYKNREDRDRMISLLNEMNSYKNQEVVFVRRNGEEFMALVSSAMYTDDSGKSYWDGAIRDISEQYEERRKARENNQFLESINKNINEAIYRSVKGEGLLYVNEAFIKMFGYDSEKDILKSNVAELYRNRKERRRVSEELVKNGFVTNREVEFQKKDGTRFWGSLSTIKTVGHGGTIYFDGAIRDITQQKETEQALKQQAQMQSLLIKISTSYINLPLEKVEGSIQESLKDLGEFVGADRAYIFDIDFHKGTWSNTYEWCADGISQERDKSQNLPITIIGDIIDLYIDGQSFVVEDVNDVKNKEYKSYLKQQGIKSLLSVPIMAGKYCVGFVGFDSVKKKYRYKDQDVSLLKLFAELMVNIHTRTQNEQELGKLLDTANDQNKRLKDFSYITSHNMRSSVANLIGLINVIEENPGEKHYIDMLRTTTKKLSEVINNINELLNFEHEISTLKREVCDLSKIISSVLELSSVELKKKKISVVTLLGGNLKVEGYAAYFESIFYNLVTNAAKYGITSKSKKIEIVGEKVGKEVMIMVKDYGLGIDLERFKDKIFRLGARFHSKRDQGQGLGLFMTKHQVEAMGGRIEVESEIDVGTTFKVYFNGKKGSKNITS